MKIKILKLISSASFIMNFIFSLSATPIAKHPDNPHYFIYNGKPLVLITTDQHYGAVINLDFDYIAFLNTLKEFGMNLTRIYPGGYVEMKDQYIAGNPLGPAPDRYILPWAQSHETGANQFLGHYKLDLNTWNSDYFTRLKDFVYQASIRNIIVEIAFFNGMYDDRWMAQPLFHSNNIQNVGTCAFQQFTTLADERLVKYQKEYVKKIASELYKYDNLIYDISDEPEMQRQDSHAWNSALLDALISVDHNRHIYGETANSASPDFTGDKRISWIPTEYISPMEITLNNDYIDNKPIIDVETAYYPFWYSANPIEETRVEGWYGMLGGLAGLIHLNSDFSTKNPTASGTDTRTKVLPQKQVLMSFMYSLDFIRMAKFVNFGVLHSEALGSAIAEPGKQYALYLFHGTKKWEEWPQGPTADRFTVNPEWFQDSIHINVLSGNYRIEWINPSSGELIDSSHQVLEGGDIILHTPRYYTDIALRMKSITDLKEVQKPK
jgi:hypothetical protein